MDNVEDKVARLMKNVSSWSGEYHRRKINLSGLPDINGCPQGIGSPAADMIGPLGPGEILLIGARGAKQGRTVFFDMLKDGFVLAGYGVALIPQDPLDLAVRSICQKITGRCPILSDLSDDDCDADKKEVFEFLQQFELGALHEAPQDEDVRRVPIAKAIGAVARGCESLRKHERRVLMIDAYDFMLDDVSLQSRSDFLCGVRQVLRNSGCAAVITCNAYSRGRNDGLAPVARHAVATVVLSLRPQSPDEITAKVDVFGNNRPRAAGEFKYQVDWATRNLRCMGVN